MCTDFIRGSQERLKLKKSGWQAQVEPLKCIMQELQLVGKVDEWEAGSKSADAKITVDASKTESNAAL